MNDLLIFRGALLLAAILELGTAVWLLRLRPEKRDAVDRIPRNKYAGILLGFPALLWCVPHAQPIVFNWMLPMLYPAAVIFTVLAWFFLDYLCSRALGGILILSTYFFVYSAFEWHTPYLPLFSGLYWILGIAGICFSGKPCWMRDLLRLCCSAPRYRYITAGFCAVLAAASLLAAILTGSAQGGM